MAEVEVVIVSWDGMLLVDCTTCRRRLPYATSILHNEVCVYGFVYGCVCLEFGRRRPLDCCLPLASLPALVDVLSTVQ